jgi:tRNA A-37 threonylcarbamoyl transferase component Bud32
MPERLTPKTEQEQHYSAEQQELGELENAYGNDPLPWIALTILTLLIVVIISIALIFSVHFGLTQLFSAICLTGILSYISFIIIKALMKMNLNKSLFLYERGLVQKTKRGSTVIRWDQVCYLQYSSTTSGSPSTGYSTTYSYTVQGCYDAKITFDGQIESHDSLFRRIKQQTNPYLLSQARKRHQAGQEIHFGQLIMGLEGIITHNRRKMLFWSEIASIKVSSDGSLKIRKKGKKLSWFNPVIPNAEILEILVQEMLEKQSFVSPIKLIPRISQLTQRYKIIGQSGQGGYGTVYKAYDRERRNRLVAIKQIDLNILSPRETIEATDTYNREVQHLSTLEDKNLPRIYDYFTDPEHWYIVMEYIQGETLEDTLARKPLPIATVIDIGITLCSVLGYLHSQNPPIIFRDVKPSNIMRTPAGHLYLIDFGIARRYSPGKHRDTGPLGSPGYAAPEQYGRAQTTTQTDIYGLGATLQTLLTGKEPLEIAQTGAYDLIPVQLQPLLNQMLEPESSKRPQNMDEVKRQLLSLRKKFHA